MSFGMFCAIPLPAQLWDDACVNLVLPCFPLVGALTGAIWLGTAKLLAVAGAHAMPAAAALALLPFFLSGFIHLDGYMDTNDAVMSRRPHEERMRILKDPHTGAFAVIMTAALFILQFAASYAVYEARKPFALLIAIAVVSRCCASASVFFLKTMPGSGYAGMFSKNVRAAHKVFVIIIAICAAAYAIYMSAFAGLAVVAAVVLGFSAAMAVAYKNLGGVSGDLAGYALVAGELSGLYALALL